MEKFRKWAKRPVNTNFLLFMAIAMFLAVFAGVSYLSRMNTSDVLDNLNEWVEETGSSEEISDIEGYGVILGSIAYDVGSVGNAVLIFITVYVPLFISILTAVQTVFVRLIYRADSADRILCYRVFMGICCAVTALLFILFSLVFFIKFTTGLLMLAADIAVIAAVIICIRNTYTNRIKE